MSSVDAAWIGDLRTRLLAWYDHGARRLPWRVGPRERAAGAGPDPYRVWLSEVMLQQTTTPHATPYFVEFTARWPTVTALAAADDDELMSAWAGLGYYARARNLLACARAVADRHGGAFPDSEAALRALPGIGGYTAAAVAAIAFDRPANVVDGNVERVVSRLFAVERPLPQAKRELTRLAGWLVRDERPGDWAQALMDLGATLCRPRSPLCHACPVAGLCAALKTGEPASYPRRMPRAARPRRYGVAYALRRGGRFAASRRPAKGLLGGMLGLPTSDWRSEPWTPAEALAAAPVAADWRPAGQVEHVFTHFALMLDVLSAEIGDHDPPDLIWLADAGGLPTLFRKAVSLV